MVLRCETAAAEDFQRLEGGAADVLEQSQDVCRLELRMPDRLGALEQAEHPFLSGLLRVKLALLFPRCLLPPVASHEVDEVGRMQLGEVDRERESLH